MISKEFFGVLSIGFTMVAHIPYIWSVFKGRTKPHIFSWTIWGLLTAIAMAGQVSAQAGPGAWATGMSAFFCFLTVILCFRYGEKNITRHDIVLFAAALLSLPLWYITDQPLAAIMLVTLIDVLGYGPTLRKSWARPHQEMPLHYVVSNLKHLTSITAMSTYSVTTLLYPVVLFMMNLVLVGIIFWRRRLTPAVS